MTRRPPTPEVIIVERRQVVVYQRIRMQHLDRCAELFYALRQLAGDHACGFHAQDRTKPFATSEHAVTHGLMNDGRKYIGTGKQPLERSVSELLALCKSFLQHEASSIAERLWSMPRSTAELVTN